MLLDTSGLLAYHLGSEATHKKARRLFESHDRMLTHSLVFVEFVALANARKLKRISCFQFLSTLMEHPCVEIIWVDQAMILEAFSLLKARLDKSYSLCDAASFVIMKQRGMTSALTTDHHFEQEGFQALLR